MKGKFLVSVLAMVMVLTSMGVCFAESNGIQPRYVASKYVTANLSISGATASVNAKVKSIDQNSLDSVAVTVRIINSNTKETVKTWNQNLTKDSTNSFCYDNSVKLTTKGTYYTTVVAKCYKSGKLVETISVESKVATY